MQIYFLQPSFIIFTKGANNSDQHCIYLYNKPLMNYSQQGNVIMSEKDVHCCLFPEHGIVQLINDNTMNHFLFI